MASAIDREAQFLPSPCQNTCHFLSSLMLLCPPPSKAAAIAQIAAASFQPFHSNPRTPMIMFPLSVSAPESLPHGFTKKDGRQTASEKKPKKKQPAAMSLQSSQLGGYMTGSANLKGGSKHGECIGVVGGHCIEGRRNQANYANKLCRPCNATHKSRQAASQPSIMEAFAPKQ